ncbi:MAG: hypothetical protein FWD17_10840 [Polyangiaceae bacterium]|nr:hypothetical protein [Polyangiaceae bacterium]
MAVKTSGACDAAGWDPPAAAGFDSAPVGDVKSLPVAAAAFCAVSSEWVQKKTPPAKSAPNARTPQMTRSERFGLAGGDKSSASAISDDCAPGRLGPQDGTGGGAGENPDDGAGTTGVGLDRGAGTTGVARADSIDATGTARDVVSVDAAGGGHFAGPEAPGHWTTVAVSS